MLRYLCRKNATDIPQQMINQSREHFLKYIKPFSHHLKEKLDDLVEQITKMQQEGDYHELDLHRMQQKLNQLKEELVQPSDLALERQPPSCVNFVSLRIKSSKIDFVEKTIHYKRIKLLRYFF